MRRSVLFFIGILFGGYIHAQPGKYVQSTLQSATIMRVGAELEHTAKATLISGNNEIIIEGLSAFIDENSLKVQCSGGVTVAGSEFSKDYLSVAAPSPSVKKLEDSIEYCNAEIERLNIVLSTNNDLRSLLKENKSIAGTQQGLKVEELVKMMDYYKSKSIELETEKSTTEEKKTKFNAALTSLNSQLAQEKRKNDKVFGQLRLNLVSPLQGSCNLTITYYTASAYWVPYYDLQASASDKPVNLICKAKFMQTTGLDWKKVGLTLSTATPNNGKVAPVFNTWLLDFQHDYSTHFGDKMMMTQNRISYAQEERSEVLDLKYAPKPTQSAIQPIYVLNGQEISPDDFQSIDPKMIASINVLKDASSTALYGAKAANGVIMVTLKSNFVSESENESDITYSIDLPYDVLANGSEQSVTLRTLELPATYEYYCAPKLDKSVYLLAGIKDWTQYNLLPGEATITYSGTYSGKSFIDPGSTDPILHLTLGNDKRVVVKREKMQDFSSTKFLGNDKKQQLTYQLTVKNNKNIPIQMILKDQYPISSNKNIVVEVLETSQAHVNTDVGTLTWEFPLKAGETRTFKVSYSVKYPKDEMINL